MEGVDGSGSGSESGSRRGSRSESGKLPKNESPQESKVCEELSKILNGVQMMSDSLAGCSRMSKHRTLRKGVKVNDRVGPKFSQSSRVSVQDLSPTEIKILNGNRSEEKESIVASFIAKVYPKKKKDETQKNLTSENEEKLIASTASDEGLTKYLDDSLSRKREGLYLDTLEESSKVRLYNPASVIPEKMIDVIQRELKTLMKLSPSLDRLLVNMYDIMSHYKSCSKCRNNIHYTFPWILNKLQKLIKYILTQRKERYIWPNDYSYLRLEPDESTANKLEDTEFLAESSPPEEQKIQIGKSEKIDPLVVSESLPGVQLLLEVKSRHTKKRLFRKVSKEVQDYTCPEFPVVELQKASHIPVHVVLRHQPVAEVSFSEKRGLTRLKLISYRSLLIYKFPSLPQYSIETPVPWSRILRIKKKKNKKRKVVQPESQSTDQVIKKSNDTVSFFTKNILTNFSKLIFDFMAEGEEDKMQMQKVRELEAEVKELRSLMLIVRRNQAELSKVFEKKNISSHSLLKFTSPDMLQEEDWFVNQISDIKLYKTTTFSLEALQNALGTLKRKCNLKNRLILTMLKGFESNVPKEWWNEILSLMFGYNTDDDLSAEKIGGFLRKTSFFLRNGEQASSALLPPTRFDERPSKEEPIMKGKMGADVEDNLKILSEFDDKCAEIIEDMLLPLGYHFPISIFAYPAVLEQNLDSSIRRLKYQVSILNVENERLWQEILDLRDVLKSSRKKVGQKVPHRTSDESSLQTSLSNGKTLIIKIQVASEKKQLLSTNTETLKITKGNKTSKSSARRESSVSALSTYANDDYFSNLKEKLEYKEPIQDKKVAILETGLKIPWRAERRRSMNDFNYLEDATPSTSDTSYRENEEKIKALLLRRTSTPLKEQVITGHTRLSEQGFWNEMRPVPSMHIVSEATTNYLAGPSRKPPDVEDYFKSPSGIELGEGQSDGVLSLKERELHPILEDDSDLDPEPSGSVNEAIQFLRDRVRLIQKDVTVLKSKNDRIDKVLSRLFDEFRNNNESFEEIQKALHLKK